MRQTDVFRLKRREPAAEELQGSSCGAVSPVGLPLALEQGVAPGALLAGQQTVGCETREEFSLQAAMFRTLRSKTVRSLAAVCLSSLKKYINFFFKGSSPNCLAFICVFHSAHL